MQILKKGDERLLVVSKPVEEFTPELAALAADLKYAMVANRGVGLAAPQVGINIRMFVTKEWAEGQPTVFINPELVESKYPDFMSEGCLSVPGVKVNRRRFGKVTVRAQDETGKPFEVTARGIFAQCIQHEIDHLDGRLIE